MKVVFADTFYWVSFVNPKDVWYNQVRKVVKALQPLRIVTIDEVLVEFLTLYSDYGPQMRRRSVELVRGILNDPLSRRSNRPMNLFCPVLICMKIASIRDTV